MRVLVTGWAGFIGSNLVRRILKETDWTVIGMDKQTYAARPLWVYKFVQDDKQYKNRFIECEGANDIRDEHDCIGAIDFYKPDVVIHLAAESHVCRSLESPGKFVQTNIVGTFNLLEAVRKHEEKTGKKIRFQHISTDEVFGELGETGRFTEKTQYAPRSPYAASKAASDHLVNSYSHSFGMDTVITNCSNNFGPNQHEEKLIPKTILSILKGKELTIYGTGEQVRDWIWVDDHCDGIISSIARGKKGDSYLLGGRLEMSNLGMIGMVWDACLAVAQEDSFPITTMTFRHTNDRPTDDKRYAINCTKARGHLGWGPKPELAYERIKETIRWYRKFWY